MPNLETTLSPAAAFALDLDTALPIIARIVDAARTLLGESERLALKFISATTLYVQDAPFTPQTWATLETLGLVEIRPYTNAVGVTFERTRFVTERGVVVAKLLGLYGYEPQVKEGI